MSAVATARKPRRRFSLRKDWIGLTGAAILIAIVGIAIFADFITTHDPLTQRVINRFLPPAFMERGKAAYLLGTDQLGRDLLSRVVYGSRISLAIGAITAVFTTLLGSALGIAAAYARGTFEAFFLRSIDIHTAFPFMVIAVAVVAVVGASPTTIVVTLMLWFWVPFARVAHSETIRVLRQEYVAAAGLSGSGGMRTLLRHVIPNIVPPLIVIFTFTAAQVVVAESALSFLGLGIQPPQPTWGSIISQGRDVMNIAPWIVLVPAIAVTLLVLAANMLGEWLREWLDPHSKKL